MTYDLHHHHYGRGPAAAMASAWNTLCCLPATQPWLWLVRSGANEAAAPIGLVLLDVLPRLLGAFGAGAFGHG